MLKEFTLSEAQQFGRAIGAADAAFQMDEQSFRTFYDRTARPLWSYLYRTSGNAALADDLMQESYFRFLRVRFPEMNQDYMKNYLFRIATNLMRDHWRHSKVEPSALTAPDEVEQPRAAANEHGEQTFQLRSDVMNVMQGLKPRERELLWLAYVEGSSHREIAETIGLKEQSIRSLLFRARNKLATLMRRRGLGAGRA
ncbi:MAG TPA: RNA polymerase sigma factor [Candidatus Acidoferrales bacterium]|nr:RNA polymerase sigma factor [Candidatus Acidoferrales bacterium]